MSKPMSAREYRAHVQSLKQTEPTETVTLASGSVFELRRPDLQGYILTGRLPQSLLTEAMTAWKANGIVSAEDITKQMGDQEVIDSLIFMREVVHECCVNPKFVEIATEDDEISAEDILPADFNEIFAWAMNYQGVAGRDALVNFREGSARGASADSSDGEKQRTESVEPATTVARIIGA